MNRVKDFLGILGILGDLGILGNLGKKTIFLIISHFSNHTLSFA